MRTPFVLACLTLPLLAACPAPPPAVHDGQGATLGEPANVPTGDPVTLSGTAVLETVRFTAVVRPSEDTHGHAFHGVVLHAEDGTRWVASYARDELWDSFAGARVAVEGERYQPQGRAIAGPHVRVTSLKVINPDKQTYAGMGALVEIAGHFEEWTVPEGQALSGEAFTRFVTLGSGRTYFPVPKTIPTNLARGVAVDVRARMVDPSPFVRSFGGPFLWIYQVTPR